LDVSLDGVDSTFGTSRTPQGAPTPTARTTSSPHVEAMPDAPPTQQAQPEQQQDKEHEPPQFDRLQVRLLEQQQQQQKRKEARERLRLQELRSQQQRKADSLAVANREARAEAEALAGFIRDHVQLQQQQTLHLQSKIAHFQATKPDFCQYLLTNFVQIQQLQVQQLEKTKEAFASFEAERAEIAERRTLQDDEDAADATFRRIQEEEEEAEREHAKAEREREEEEAHARQKQEEQQQRQADIDAFGFEIGVIGDEEGEAMFASNPRRSNSHYQEHDQPESGDEFGSNLAASEAVPLSALQHDSELLFGAQLQEDSDAPLQARPAHILDHEVDFDSFDPMGTFSSSNPNSAENLVTPPSSHVHSDSQQHAEVDFSFGESAHSHDWPPKPKETLPTREPGDEPHFPPRASSREHGVLGDSHAYDTRVVRRRRSDTPHYRGNIMHNTEAAGGGTEAGGGEEASDEPKAVHSPEKDDLVLPRDPLPKPNSFSNDFQEKGKRLQNMLLMRKQVKENNESMVCILFFLLFFLFFFFFTFDSHV
jgi:hypothetical protein